MVVGVTSLSPNKDRISGLLVTSAGVLPFSSRMDLSALAAKSIVTILPCPLELAQCNAVLRGEEEREGEHEERAYEEACDTSSKDRYLALINASVP